jgi:hypothetical protein
MGGRGIWLCRNIAVPSSALEKPNVVFYTNKVIWIRRGVD